MFSEVLRLPLRSRLNRAIAIVLAMLVLGFALAFIPEAAMADTVHTTFYGGADGYCGNVTASGAVYDCSGYTAASNTYAMGTELLVCYDGCVEVTVNDICGCPLDLSLAAADSIGITAVGADAAEVTVL